MSSTKPLLVVLGATGNQGGSVLSYFNSLPDSPYVLRGVSRDIKSSKSTALASQGIEMVEAAFDNPASLDAAFQNASAIYSVTNFWTPLLEPSIQEKATSTGTDALYLCMEVEIEHNKSIIDAAARCSTLERFVYSSMPNTKKLSNGKYPHIYHFDGKAIAGEYGEATYPELWKKTSVFTAGYFLENYWGEMGALVRPKLSKDDGNLKLAATGDLGSMLLPMYSVVNDTGALVHALLRTNPVKLLGVKEWISYRDFAKILAEVLGKTITFIDSNPDFRTGNAEMDKEYEDMMGFCAEFLYDGSAVDKSHVEPKDLGVPITLKSVKEWCADQDWDKLLQVEE